MGEGEVSGQGAGAIDRSPGALTVSTATVRVGRSRERRDYSTDISSEGDSLTRSSLRSKRRRGNTDRAVSSSIVSRSLVGFGLLVATGVPPWGATGARPAPLRPRRESPCSFDATLRQDAQEDAMSCWFRCHGQATPECPDSFDSLRPTKISPAIDDADDVPHATDPGIVDWLPTLSRCLTATISARLGHSGWRAAPGGSVAEVLGDDPVSSP